MFEPYPEIEIDSETFYKILNDDWTEEEQEHFEKGLKWLFELDSVIEEQR